MPYEFTPEEELILAQLETHEDSRNWPPSIAEKFKFGQTEIRGLATLLRSLAGASGGGGALGVYHAPLVNDPANVSRHLFHIQAPAATPIRQVTGYGVAQLSAYDGVNSGIWQTKFDFSPVGLSSVVASSVLAPGVGSVLTQLQLLPLGGGAYAISWFVFGLTGLSSPTVKSSGLLFCPDTDIVVTTP